MHGSRFNKQQLGHGIEVINEESIQIGGADNDVGDDTNNSTLDVGNDDTKYRIFASRNDSVGQILSSPDILLSRGEGKDIILLHGRHPGYISLLVWTGKRAEVSYKGHYHANGAQ